MEESKKKVKIDQLSAATGAISIKKLRRRRHKKIITKLLADYASNSTLHGLRYVASKELNLFEKILWLTTFVISIALCGYFINNVYIKWKTSPVIISVSERMISVSSVPFPSITICPQIKSVPYAYNVSSANYKMNKMLMSNKSLDPEDVDMYEDILLVCGKDYLESDANITLKSNRSYTDSSVVKRINKVSPNHYDFILDCLINNSTCIANFRRVLTSEGVCFNLNGLAADEIFREDSVQSEYKYTESDEPSRAWSYVNGYGDSDDPYPRRGNENGASPDLQVYLFTDSDERDELCNPLQTGYNIYISHPTDLPQSSMYHYAATDGHVSSLAVSVHVLNTSETLIGYSAEDRQCYFPNDRELRYFKIYTMNNCRAECLSNYTYQKCGCVGFYMPYHNSSKICTIKKLDCMIGAKDYMVKEELRRKLSNEVGGCRCLPACYSVEYDAEILKTDYRRSDLAKRIFRSWNGTFDDSVYKYSQINVYFKKPEFVSMRRSELFGLTDFVANIGGLLGVFLGFSFLSVIEIIYFFTLRIGFTLKRDLKNEKKNLNQSNSIKNDKF